MKSDIVRLQVTRYRRLAAEAERLGWMRDGYARVEAFRTAAVWRWLADDIELNLGDADARSASATPAKASSPRPSWTAASAPWT